MGRHVGSFASLPRVARLGAYVYGSGERWALPAASRSSRAARVRAPSRGDPPHDGRFAQLGVPDWPNGWPFDVILRRHDEGSDVVG